MQVTNNLILGALVLVLLVLVVMLYLVNNVLRKVAKSNNIEIAPKEIKANVPKEEAEKLKKELEAAGAKVELK